MKNQEEYNGADLFGAVWKVISAIITLALAVWLLSGCEKFDDDVITNEDLFVGTWEFYSMWYDGDDGEQLTFKGNEAFTHLEDNDLHFFDFEVYKSRNEYYIKYKYFNTNSWIDNNISFNVMSSTSSKSGQREPGNSVQCRGETQAGNRCKNKTLNLNNHCYLHQSQSYRTEISEIITKSPNNNHQVYEYGLSSLSLKDYDVESYEGYWGYKHIALEYYTPNGKYRIWFDKDGFTLGETDKKSATNSRNIEMDML